MAPTRTGLAALALAFLAACEPVIVVDPGPGPRPPRDACGAERLERFVGRPFRDLRPRLDPRVPTRVLRPGDAVTMDHSPWRLNVQLNRSNRVVRVYCG
jgi:hypothetical protein